MRGPFRINERLFALYYPPLCALAENAGQRETRKELVGQARGRTLELGAGSGLNLPHYGDAVSELVITEPSPHMRRHLERALAEDPPVPPAVLKDATVQDLPFPDASFDTVVATFVLCTVPDPAVALAEIARVLRPGGHYLFLEHVHAGEGTWLGRFQDAVEGIHTYVAAGCHPNRRTEEAIAASDLEIEHCHHGHQPRSPPTVRPTIIGSARVRG